jgi:hypothetical protein
MADLTIPQRQTYPTIRGHVSDHVGLLPLDQADEITLLLEAGADLFALPVTVIDPPETFDLGGESVEANWEASIGAGATDDENIFRSKLKIVWDATATPPLVQYAPQIGFIEIEVAENVVESP